eukprot:PITA_02960
MKDGDSVTEHLNAFNTVVSQLSSVDIKISDEDKCISLLCSLPDLWDSLVIAIGKPIKVVCWKCRKEGHFKRDCKSKAPDKGKGSNDAPSVEAKTTSDEGGDVCLASSSTYLDHEAWLIDSGASFHFTPHREWFCEYEKYDGGDVFFGDDKKARTIGRGKIRLKLQGGRVRTLLGVLDIPALARNLISQNGVAERMNKTLMERARSMLSGAGLGQEFWAKAVDTACYLVNRSPSSALEDKTPQEVWTGKKPSLSHLRGYKLWNPVTRKVVYSRDVVFREVQDVIKYEVQPKEPVKIEFELKQEESDSVTEEESEDEEPQTPAVRRSVREKRQPERYSPSAFCSNFALSVTNDDPRTVKEVVDSKDGKLWKGAMVHEMASLQKNKAWDLVELSARKKPIGSKWVFKKKTNAEGKVEKYKARLVAKGYSQVPTIDFGDIFSPVAKVTSIRLLLSIVAAFDFEVQQMDVKTTFLHGDLEEEIYMKQPEGFAMKGMKELVCKLKKSLYGLKQSPRMWYQKFDTFIRGIGFTRSKADHCVYFELIGDRVIYMVLYVDDMLLVGNDKEII